MHDPTFGWIDLIAIYGTLGIVLERYIHDWLD